MRIDLPNQYSKPVIKIKFDANSEDTRESFIDFFNNEEAVKSQLEDSAPAEITVKTETAELTKVSILETPQPDIASSKNDTKPSDFPCCEDTEKDSIEVIFGSYTSSITLGRGRSATINLGGSNRKVSRRHAVISWEETSGAFTINVIGANGLYIDGALFKAKCSKKLMNGNIIDVAGIRYRFQIPHLDYLPSPPFGSPAPTAEAEQSADAKGCSTDKDSLRTPQIIKENSTNGSKRPEKSQSELNNPRSKAFRNISPASSICNSSLRSDDPIDGSSDSELSYCSSDMDLSDLESSDNSDSDLSSASEECTRDRKRPRTEKSPKPKIDPSQKELIDNIVAAIVFTGKHMLSASEIFSSIATDYSAFYEKRRLTELDVARCLHRYPFFGHVVRKGKDAGGKPLADLWHYAVNSDPDPERRDTYKPLVKGTRSCTLKDKQYYFKPPPKVPSIKYSTQSLPSGRKRSKKSKKTSETRK
ncbi:hypothetical protein K493DRAFT_409638 [Basidiobolus meristosporus CBS 931.73]|uniref:FHA domain-containing protein n=1 Tax=Basidiobolus meristosporus CBS 931.73 TaxID=1314790 RepID=A0A1Y1XYM5_9FUNG|nr:hypothetical protein K493DRAFT_409638 [Basidiobolus meristosporus CBS 931.73]|eukprot:ORX90863.1 hypothetical protein K493DRAFT_409638 [Basidiobolus meristosporus CBS 931.73]